MIDSIVVATCRGGHGWILEDQGPMCPKCRANWCSTSYTTRKKLEDDIERAEGVRNVPFQVQTFKPFTSDAFTGKPVKVTSKRGREKICQETHSTFDSCKNTGPKTYAPAIDTIDYGDVKQALEKGGLDPEEHQLDLPDATDE